MADSNRMHERHLWPFTWAALTAMAADFDAEITHTQIDYLFKAIAIGIVGCVCSRGSSKRFSLWRRDSVTSLVPIGYLVQSWMFWIKVRFAVTFEVAIWISFRMLPTWSEFVWNTVTLCKWCTYCKGKAARSRIPEAQQSPSLWRW